MFATWNLDNLSYEKAISAYVSVRYMPVDDPALPIDSAY